MSVQPTAATSSLVTVALVACGKRKLDHPAPARDLYTGPLFRRAAAYAEIRCDRWYVLSAFHGLVAPDTELHPYDRSLTSAGDRERDAWASRVDFDLRRLCRGDSVRVVVLAGAAYRDHLAYRLRKWADVETPLAGLPIGAQLAWLAAETADTTGGSR